jgi:hypothetical protein
MNSVQEIFNVLRREGIGVGEGKLLPDAESSITPGNFYVFEYNKQIVSALGIATNRTATGSYISSRGNKLVTTLKFDLSNQFQMESMIQMLKTIYKSKKAKYNRITQTATGGEKFLSRFFQQYADKVRSKTMLSLFGKSNFRTYNLSKINKIIRVSLNFPNQEEEE